MAFSSVVNKTQLIAFLGSERKLTVTFIQTGATCISGHRWSHFHLRIRHALTFIDVTFWMISIKLMRFSNVITFSGIAWQWSFWKLVLFIKSLSVLLSWKLFFYLHGFCGLGWMAGNQHVFKPGLTKAIFGRTCGQNTFN